MGSKKEKGNTAILNGAEESAERKKRWEKETFKPSLEKMPERDTPFTTVSGVEIKDIYDPYDNQENDY